MNFNKYILIIYPCNYNHSEDIELYRGISLVVRWLRLHFLMQGIQI